MGIFETIDALKDVRSRGDRIKKVNAWWSGLTLEQKERARNRGKQ